MKIGPKLTLAFLLIVLIPLLLVSLLFAGLIEKNLTEQMSGQTAAAIIIVAVMGVGLTAFYLARSITQPIVRLTQAATRISQGDLSQRVEATSADEIGTLGQTFNQMTQELQETQIRLAQQNEALQAELVQRKRIEEIGQQSEARYRSLFEDSPVALWEEDYSAVKKQLDDLHAAGVSEFRTYFENHPEVIAACAERVKILDVNKAAQELHGATGKEQLLGGLNQFLGGEFKNFKAELLALWAGQAEIVSESFSHTLANEKKYLRIKVSVAPGCEKNWSRILVSAIDLTQRQQAEKELQKYKEYLEQLVQERTVELTHAVEQLEQEITERRQAEATLHATLTKTEALYRIGQTIVSTGSLPDLLQGVVDSVVEAVPADRALLITVDINRQKITQFIKSGPGLEQIVTITFDELWQGLSGWVMREKQAALSPKGLPDERESSITQQRRLETNCGAIVVVPLLYRDNVLGTLTAINQPTERDFTQADVDLLLALANQAAIILEHKLAEEALRESEERFRRLSDATFEGIVIHEHGNIFDANQSFARMVGYELSEVMGLGALEFAAPEYRELIRQNIQSGYEKPYEVVGIKKDGSTFPAEIWAKSLPYQGRRLRVAAIRDITERKQAEAALRESERRIFQFLEAVPIGVFVVDAAGKPYYANQVSQQLLGQGIVPNVELEQISTVYQAYIAGTNQIYPMDQAPIARALAGENVVNEDVEIHQSEQIVTLETMATPIFDANGQVEYAIAVFQDITERKRAEEALRESETRLRTIGDNLPGGVIYQYVLDPDGHHFFTYLSQGIEQLTGLRVEEILLDANRLHDLFVAEDRQRLQQATRESAINLNPFDLEARRHLSNGEIRWSHFRSAPRRLDNGRTVWDGVELDITQRKLAEAALRQSEERFRQLAENIREVFWMNDPTLSETIYISPTYEEVWGRSCESVYQEPKSWLEAIHPEDRAQVIATLEEQKMGKPISQEYRIVLADRSIRWIWDRSFPIFDEFKKFYRTAGISEDITAWKQAEKELRQYATELQARNEELDAFAHTVAHDLKAPLAPIIGLAEVLAEEYASLSGEELHKHLLAIHRSGRKMHNIIRELLLLASVRRQEVELTPLNMMGIVFEAQQRLNHHSEEHQAEIILPASWPVALGYGPWVEEIWVNYLSNAIKYGGRPPQIELGATILAETRMVSFWVRDNGPGLSRAEQEQLFTPFTRLNQVQAKGHGLGLSIVRRIVEKLGGQAGVESEKIPGQGAKFSFTLPLAKPAQKAFSSLSKR